MELLPREECDQYLSVLPKNQDKPKITYKKHVIPKSDYDYEPELDEQDDILDFDLTDKDFCIDNVLDYIETGIKKLPKGNVISSKSQIYTMIGELFSIDIIDKYITNQCEKLGYASNCYSKINDIVLQLLKNSGCKVNKQIFSQLFGEVLRLTYTGMTIPQAVMSLLKKQQKKKT